MRWTDEFNNARDCLANQQEGMFYFVTHSFYNYKCRGSCFTASSFFLTQNRSRENSEPFQNDVANTNCTTESNIEMKSAFPLSGHTIFI